jgi:outer membrane receptor for ferrienterochelin and colicin
MRCFDFVTPGLGKLVGATRVFFLIQLSFLVIFFVSEQPVFGQEPSSEISEASDPSEVEDSISEGPSELSLFEDIPTVVTASKKPERITEASSIISVITEEDIQHMGARDIMDVLRTIPGIEIMKDAWGVSQIAVRGLRSDSSAGVKILVDGHALDDPFTGGATEFYDNLPLKNVRRIEIIRGPASSIYGANAFVSVVNIITKEAQDIDGTEISVGTGSFDTFNASLLFGKTLNELELSFYADYYTTDGDKLFINTDWMNLYDENTSGIFPPISLAPGNFRDEEERFNFSYKFKYLDFTLHGGFFSKHWGPFLTEGYILNEGSTEEVEHSYLDLEYRRFFTERLEFIGKMYADVFGGERVEQVAPGITLPTPSDEWFVYPNGLIWKYRANGWRIGGETQINYRLFDNNDLTVGAACEYLAVEDFRVRTNEFNYIRGFPPDELHDLADLIPDVQTSSYQTVVSVFAQDKWKIRRNVDLTLGVRGDLFSDLEENWGIGGLTPKVGITYQPKPNLNIKTLFGSAFRVPSFLETFIVREEQGSPEREELDAEVLGTFEFGVGYKPVDWLIGEVNYFSTGIRELAETSENGEGGFSLTDSSRIYQNIGGIDVQGVEFELRGESEQKIDLGIIPRIIRSSFRLNYSYQDTKDSTTHEKVPNMARHKGNIGIGLDLSAGKEKAPGRLSLFRSFSDEFSLYFNVFLCGKRERSQDDIRDALPGFAILDMTLTAHDVFHKKLGLSFSMKNIFDTDYRDPSPEFAPEDEYSAVLDDFPNPGRSFFLELRYTF